MELIGTKYALRTLRGLTNSKLRGYIVILNRHAHMSSSIYIWKGEGYYFFTNNKGKNQNYRLLRDAIYGVLNTY